MITVLGLYFHQEDFAVRTYEYFLQDLHDIRWKEMWKNIAWINI